MFKSNEKITVTQPFLPPLPEVTAFMQGIWDSKWLTNSGAFHKELETQLARYLNVPYVALCANGTLALVIALQVLRVTGEVITTPFSFVATTHALWWNNIRPPKTTGILPVHVYGHPCKTDRLQEIADIFVLHLIYDAAHAFGTRLRGTSIANFGDLSVLSFHATKIFNTFEGGAIICHDQRTYQRINYLKNFGFAGETTVVAPGINAKLNEFQAGMGLLQLKYMDEILAKRKAIADRYTTRLSGLDGISFLPPGPEVDYNHAYFPIFVDAAAFGRTRDDLYSHLKSYNYLCRRYFYPLISSFNMYKSLPGAEPGNLPVATLVAEEVLCLPIFPDLGMEHVYNVTNIITNYKK